MIWIGTSGYNYPEWKGSAGGEDAALLRGAFSDRRDLVSFRVAPPDLGNPGAILL